MTQAGVALAAVFAVAFGGATAAQRASRPVPEWIKVLESPERIAGLKVDDVVSRLGLRPGDVVVDLGAGAGPFVPAFAKAVGPKGKVYAVEVDRAFFPYIEDKAKAAGVSNVQVVHGEFTDPKLPAADVDVAFLNDVMHHIDNQAAYFKTLGKYLKQTARLAVIDYNAADSPHKDTPLLVVSKEQANAVMAQAGFKPVQDVALFPDKWFVVYGR